MMAPTASLRSGLFSAGTPGAAVGPAASLALGRRPTFFKTQPHFSQRCPDGKLAAVQALLMLEFLLQFPQREIRLALQPTA